MKMLNFKKWIKTISLKEQINDSEFILIRDFGTDTVSTTSLFGEGHKGRSVLAFLPVRYFRDIHGLKFYLIEATYDSLINEGYR